MASREQESRKRYSEWPGIRWNVFVHVCFSNIEDLTPAQRVGHLVFLYSSEVYNGGHYQYFVNKGHWDHAEVVCALETIGAADYAANLVGLLKKSTLIQSSGHRMLSSFWPTKLIMIFQLTTACSVRDVHATSTHGSRTTSIVTNTNSS